MSDGDREQKIQARAYELWETSGGEHGRHEEHWAQAEKELGPGAPTQPEPAEGGEDAAAPLPGSPEQD